MLENLLLELEELELLKTIIIRIIRKKMLLINLKCGSNLLQPPYTTVLTVTTSRTQHLVKFACNNQFLIALGE